LPKLTKRVVDSVKPDPAGKDLFLWDREVQGFALKVTGSGLRSYVLQYRNPHGRSRRIKIGVHGSPWTCEEARLRAIELLRGLALGVDPLSARAEAKAHFTVKQLGALYLEEGPARKPDKKQSSWDTDRAMIRRHITPLLGSMPLRALRREDVERFQIDVAAGKTAADEKTRARGRAIVTGGRSVARLAVAILAAMLEFAVARKLIQINPARGVKLFKPQRRERFLTHAEVTQIADTIVAMEAESKINPNFAAAIRLLLLTGCRKSEILNLKWEWVDFERKCLRLPESKTGAKVVLLPAAAMAVLSGLDNTNEWVLPAANGNGPVRGLQKAWEEVRRKANLPNVRIHDFRHSYASFAVADGATLFMIGKVLGHKQARTTEVYAHLSEDPVRALAERTAATIAKAMSLVGQGLTNKANVVLRMKP
jgi:integrase